MWNTPIGRLRLVGMIEGASYVLLLGVAMPMKYIWGLPLAVRVVGMIHGILFIAFCGVLAEAKRSAGWSWAQCVLPFVASLLPFGPFVIDGRLRKADEAQQGETSTEG